METGDGGPALGAAHMQISETTTLPLIAVGLMYDAGYDITFSQHDGCFIGRGGYLSVEASGDYVRMPMA